MRWGHLAGPAAPLGAAGQTKYKYFTKTHRLVLCTHVPVAGLLDFVRVHAGSIPNQGNFEKIVLVMGLVPRPVLGRHGFVSVRDHCGKY